MKTIQLVSGTVEAELTTNSPKSSYGLPVLRCNGDDYGPKDWVTGLGLMAGDIAVVGNLEGTLDFLKQAADADKYWDLGNVTK
jgi:hypothetical protein